VGGKAFGSFCEIEVEENLFMKVSNSDEGFSDSWKDFCFGKAFWFFM
jgi:hypothetical protein